MRALAITLLFIAASGCQCGLTSAELDAGPTPVDGGADASIAPADAGYSVIVAIDSSASLQVTDHAGERASALTRLLDTLPNDTRVTVFAFAGPSVARVSPSHGSPLRDWTAAERMMLAQQLLAFRGSDGQQDLVAVVAAARTTIVNDGARGVGRYDVLLVTDGVGATQENELMCGDSVLLLKSESKSAARLHTTLLYTAKTISCTEQVTVASCGVTPALVTCSHAANQASAARLKRLAERLGGTFTQFLDAGTVEYRFP